MGALLDLQRPRRPNAKWLLATERATCVSHRNCPQTHYPRTPLTEESLGKLSQSADHSHLRTMHTVLLQAALETKLASIFNASDKRADIAVQQAPDALDQTQFATERDLAVSLINHESQLARLVQGALRRMQEGSYGVCLACEEPISAKRLQAVPLAELCLGCQERADRDAGGLRNANDEEGLELGSPILSIGTRR